MADLRDRRLVIMPIDRHGSDVAVAYVDALGYPHATRAGVAVDDEPETFRAAVLDAVERVTAAAHLVNLRD